MTGDFTRTRTLTQTLKHTATFEVERGEVGSTDRLAWYRGREGGIRGGEWGKG